MSCDVSILARRGAESKQKIKIMRKRAKKVAKKGENRAILPQNTKKKAKKRLKRPPKRGSFLDVSECESVLFIKIETLGLVENETMKGHQRFQHAFVSGNNAEGGRVPGMGIYYPNRGLCYYCVQHIFFIFGRN